MRSSVGIRELKSHVTSVLRRVRDGETVTVTDHDEPIALLVPFREEQPEEAVRQLVKAGRLSWSGGKPSGSKRPVAARGPSVSDAVVEDRR
jgi:prevent-host-death family protein